MIRAFSELSEEQKRNIYQFISSFEYNGDFSSCEEMSAFYGGITFDSGKSHFSLWEDDMPVGALGVVAKDASVRNEIFLTGIFFKESEEDRLPQLLSRANEYCSGISADSCKLGLNHDKYYLMPVVKRCGFNLYGLKRKEYLHNSRKLRSNFLPVTSRWSLVSRERLPLEGKLSPQATDEVEQGTRYVVLRGSRNLASAPYPNLATRD